MIKRPSNGSRLWILDLDDTLIDCHPHYLKARIALGGFFREYAASHGVDSVRLPSREEIAVAVEERDAFNHDMGGWSPFRLPISCMQVFRDMCNEFRVDYSAAECEYAYGIGEYPFREDVIRKSGFMSGVEGALDFLVGKGDTLHLVTKGEDDVQSMKLRVLGVLDKPWFRNGNGSHRIDIVQRKDADLFKRIAKDHDPGYVWVVGDSLGSDVVPGLEAGFRAVHVNTCPVPLFDKRKTAPVSDRLVTLNGFDELRGVYDSLVGRT